MHLYKELYCSLVVSIMPVFSCATESNEGRSYGTSGKTRRRLTLSSLAIGSVRGVEFLTGAGGHFILKYLNKKNWQCLCLFERKKNKERTNTAKRKFSAVKYRYFLISLNHTRSFTNFITAFKLSVS